MRVLSSFRPLAGDELKQVRSMKIGQDTVLARTDLLKAGAEKIPVYTIFSGWAYRYIDLRENCRQILDILLPGDLIGLQAPFTGKVRHSVRTLTDVSVCSLDPSGFEVVLAAHPALSEALIATLLMEEHRADMRLMLLGRQRPTERMGYLLLELRDRLSRRGTDVSGGFRLPLTYHHFADLLGISRSQVANSLTELRDRRWATITDKYAIIDNHTAMAGECQYDGLPPASLRALI